MDIYGERDLGHGKTSESRMPLFLARFRVLDIDVDLNVWNTSLELWKLKYMKHYRKKHYKRKRHSRKHGIAKTWSKLKRFNRKRLFRKKLVKTYKKFNTYNTAKLKHCYMYLPANT